MNRQDANEIQLRGWQASVTMHDLHHVLIGQSDRASQTDELSTGPHLATVSSGRKLFAALPLLTNIACMLLATDIPRPLCKQHRLCHAVIKP